MQYKECDLPAPGLPGWVSSGKAVFEVEYKASMLNCTVPVGCVDPAVGATVAVNVTDCINVEGLAELTTVVVVPAWLLGAIVPDGSPAAFAILGVQSLVLGMLGGWLGGLVMPAEFGGRHSHG